MLKQSIYTHIFQRNNHCYLYNSKTSLFAEISEDFYKVLYNRDYASLPEDTLKDLCNKGVLCEEAEQYLYYYGEQVRFNTNAYNPRHVGLVIVPTTNCNFNCPYCFEGEKDSAVMTPEVQDAIIKHIELLEKDTMLSITWYGGEPLMAFNIIEQLYSRIKELTNIKISGHSIVTNGYLINEKVIEFINKESVGSIQITLDGREKRHDELRKLHCSGKPTFKRILDNISRIINECPNTHLSIRVNVNNENIDDYFELLKYFKNNFNSKHLSVYPGFIREDTPDKCSLCYDSMDDAHRYQFYKNLYQKGVGVRFIHKAVKSRGCMMHYANSFIVGPRGELYKCWNDVNHPEKIIGYIGASEIKNMSLFLHYMTETFTFADTKCKDCLIFPICSGGCGWYRSRNLRENGTFGLCPIQKNLSILEDSLIESLEKPEIAYPNVLIAL